MAFISSFENKKSLYNISVVTGNKKQDLHWTHGNTTAHNVPDYITIHND